MAFLLGTAILIRDRLWLNVFSLTLGLMGLDDLHLRVLATSSEDKSEKRNAQKGLLRCCRYNETLIPELRQC